jgi:hypothetical protein
VNPNFGISVSVSRNYEVQEVSFDADHLSVKNLSNDQIYVVEGPAEHPYLIDWVWSPKDDQLAILWSDTPRGHFVYFGNELQLFDPVDNTTRILAQEDLTNIEWSPYGNRMVFKQGNVNSHRGACILEIETLEKNCFTSQNLLHRDLLLFSFRWLQDNQSLSYIYYEEETYDRQNEVFIRDGGLCIVNIEKGRNFCPTNQIPELDQTAIIFYQVSPDEKYFLFMYDPDRCLFCDYVGHPAIGIISDDGKIFHPIITDDPYFFESPWSYIWRPVNSLN